MRSKATGRGQVESPPPAETQGEADGVSECDDLYAQGEWDESEFIELLDCLFDSSDLGSRCDDELYGHTGEDALNGGLEMTLLMVA